MKVVCIEDNWKGSPVISPKVGEIYTVIDCMMVNNGPGAKNGPGYAFEEIPLMQGGINHWWNVKAFTPLDNYKKEEIAEQVKEAFMIKPKENA